MTRRSRAFTLVELMVVVALIGVIAAIAVVSMRRTRSTSDSDAWASTLRNMIAQARARAISTKQVYMIDLRGPTPSTAQWCQVTVDGSTCSLQSGCATVPTTCPNATTGAENGDIVYAPADARTDSTAATPDIWQPTTGYAAPTHIAVPDQIYFGSTGTVDALYGNVSANAPVGLGFTIYVRASNNVVGTATTQNQQRRRVVVYGPSGRGRIVDNWQ